jgi:(2Fe-2S) ferredoxin
VQPGQLVRWRRNNARQAAAEQPQLSSGPLTAAAHRSFLTSGPVPTAMMEPGLGVFLPARSFTLVRLDQCEVGPTVVVYPEAVWYGHMAAGDIDEIIESHIIGGWPVERLIIPDSLLDNTQQKVMADKQHPSQFRERLRLNRNLLCRAERDASGRCSRTWSAGCNRQEQQCASAAASSPTVW